MDILRRFNEVIFYVENNLADEINHNTISRIACTSYNDFCRFFSYITGMTFSEYVRKRKLSEAAHDLKIEKISVIDVAVKYGYSCADTFSRAFVRQHGVLPTAARDIFTPLCIYPPVSFHVVFKGGQKMNFRIIQTDEIEVYGISRNFSAGASQRYDFEHIMWDTHLDNIPAKISKDYNGKWYGIWQDDRYIIGREKSDAAGGNLEKYIIPARTYAAFETEKGGFAGDELPKLHDLIFNSWLPNCEYAQVDNLEIEVYHLRTDKTARKKERYYEIWIPVKLPM